MVSGWATWHWHVNIGEFSRWLGSMFSDRNSLGTRWSPRPWIWLTLPLLTTLPQKRYMLCSCERWPPDMLSFVDAAIVVAIVNLPGAQVDYQLPLWKLFPQRSSMFGSRRFVSLRFSTGTCSWLLFLDGMYFSGQPKVLKVTQVSLTREFFSNKSNCSMLQLVRNNLETFEPSGFGPLAICLATPIPSAYLIA